MKRFVLVASMLVLAVSLRTHAQDYPKACADILQIPSSSVSGAANVALLADAVTSCKPPIVTPPPPPPPPPTSTGLVTGLIEQCKFQFPSGAFGGAGFAYGGTALALNPSTGQYLVTGHDWYQQTAAVTIPLCGSGGAITVTKAFTDDLEGKLGLIGGGTAKIGAHLPYNGKLYVSGHLYYDGGGNQILSQFSRPLDIGVTGQVTGPVRVGPLGAGWYSSVMTLIPQAWQAALGGPALVGGCCLPIISRTSRGPSVSVFDPEHPGTAALVVGYDGNHQTLGVYGAAGSHPSYNATSVVKGVVFVGSSVLFTGRTGVGNYCYGEYTLNPALDHQPVPNEPGVIFCYDPVVTNKGEHAYPYRFHTWAYDAGQLAAAHAGTKNPWDVLPYAQWDLTGNGNNGYVGASAYDAVNNRVIVIDRDANGAYPIAHVYTPTF